MKTDVKIILLALCTFVAVSCNVKEVGNTRIGAVARQPVLPVLAKKERNEVLQMELEVRDSSLSSYNVAAFHFNLDGTSSLADIGEASVLYSNVGKIGEAAVFGTQLDVRSNFEIRGDKRLVLGKNHYWLSVKLNGIPDLSHSIRARLVSVELADGRIVKPVNDPTSKPQRIGLALRQKGQDGVNTYRIPGLATTNKGTLIAVYDNRYQSAVDLQADIDVGMSRSTDGGQTWESMKVIMDMGSYGGKPEDENGIGDAAVLVDKNTNTIWVAALWLYGHKDKRAWFASGQGITPKETGQLMLVKSEDDGLTWSKPINITKQVKDPKWRLFFDGPGAGITMADGTLVFAAQYKDENAIPHSTIIYSKDGGKIWQVGTGAKPETTEAQVVELSDGSLMLNMRDDRNRADRKDSLNGRSVATTRDLGKSWTMHPTSRKALRASNCMASILAFDYPGKGKLLFFSNPDTKVNRDHITIKASFDEGMTWPMENQMELYEGSTYGYSCLTVVDDDHIGILYEGKKELYFEKIPIAELLD